MTRRQFATFDQGCLHIVLEIELGNTPRVCKVSITARAGQSVSAKEIRAVAIDRELEKVTRAAWPKPTSTCTAEEALAWANRVNPRRRLALVAEALGVSQSTATRRVSAIANSRKAEQEAAR